MERDWDDDEEECHGERFLSVSVHPEGTRVVHTDIPVWSRVEEGIEKVFQYGGSLELDVEVPAKDKYGREYSDIICFLAMEGLPGQYRLVALSYANDDIPESYLVWWEPEGSPEHGAIRMRDDYVDARTMCQDIDVAKKYFKEVFETKALSKEILSSMSDDSGFVAPPKRAEVQRMPFNTNTGLASPTRPLKIESGQKLTVEQAYRAMFYFLNHELDLKNSKSAQLATLLRYIVMGNLMPDWLLAVQKALATDERIEQKITVEQAYRAMFYFLEYEFVLTNLLPDKLAALSWDTWVKTGSADPATWLGWLDAVQKALAAGESIPFHTIHNA
jgi:hypothetical protein